MSWFVLDQINWEVLSPSHASHPIQIEFDLTIAYLESQVIIVVTYPEDIYFLPIFQHQLRVWNPWATVVQIIGFVWQVARLLIYPQLIFLFAISSLTINQLASLKLQVAGLNSILLRSIKRPLNDKTNYFFFFFHALHRWWLWQHTKEYLRSFMEQNWLDHGGCYDNLRLTVLMN